MKSIYISTAIALLATLIGFLGPGTAMATPPMYRIVDVGPIGSAPPSRSTIGVNNYGQVCGTATGASLTNAFIWLPSAAYGLTPVVMHDLYDLTPWLPSGPFSSGANDINDGGLVAGVVFGTGDENGKGMVFDLTDMQDSGFVGAGANWAVAYAVSDHPSSPVVVGAGDGLAGCEGTLTKTQPFRAENYPGPVPPGCSPGAWCTTILLPDDDPAYDHGDSYAFAVTSPAIGLSRVVGRRRGFEGCDDTEPLVGCESSVEACTWVGGNQIDMVSIVEPDQTEHEARGINAEKLSVGFGRAADGTCRPRAMQWVSDLTDPPPPVVLGDLLPSEISSVAEAISDTDQDGNLVVVGTDVSLNRALVWYRESDVWTVHYLNDRLCGPCSMGWVLAEAHDVSGTTGLISGWGFRDGQPHAFLLIPTAECAATSCPGDLDADEVVGGLDLAILLGDWGPCGISPDCVADLSCDGIVDGEDLALLLSWYGPCSGALAAGGGPDSESGDVPSLAELVEQLESLGYPELAQLLLVVFEDN